MKLTIEKLVAGGSGLARTDNGVVFVEQVIPGEVVDADIRYKKGGVPVALPRTIIEASEHRRVPPCPYYQVCGGCDWQHIAYDQQVQNKCAIFQDCLFRIGKIGPIPDIEVYVSPEWEYRIRAQLKVSRDRKRMGFFRNRSSEVIGIKHCPLLSPGINAVLADQQRVLPVLGGKVDEIKIISGTDGAIASSPEVPGFSKNEVAVHIGRYTFIVSGGSFFQGNRFLFEKMGTWALPHVSGEVAVDIYGGSGFFSIMLAEKFSRVILVEQSHKLVAEARHNVSVNNLDMVSAMAISAEELFTGDHGVPKPDCCIVDPPRPGLTIDVRQGISRMDPHSILYISCNPSTQARDAGFFVNDCGYAVSHAALFDVYPQTHHIETALLLEK